MREIIKKFGFVFFYNSELQLLTFISGVRSAKAARTLCQLKGATSKSATDLGKRMSALNVMKKKESLHAKSELQKCSWLMKVRQHLMTYIFAFKFKK